ncbi:hypothetical protein [Anoxynatronum sibiricum]|uniref:hypothetical protein n=1 Tax=Anoxynatronum sibiricum TaxID=210623 RepID=UPI0031B84A65
MKGRLKNDFMAIGSQSAGRKFKPPDKKDSIMPVVIVACDEKTWSKHACCCTAS